MTRHTDTQTALAHVAAGTVLYHAGWWGAPSCYHWAGPDGHPAGRVPQWESEVLTLLERRGLVTVTPGAGHRDTPVVLTEAGRRNLTTRHAA